MTLRRSERKQQMKLPFHDRARAKQKSREDDQARLDAGAVSAEELRRENGFASCLPLSEFRIVSVGKKLMKDIK